MATKTPTVIERRLAQQKALDEIDLERANAVVEIFEREAVKQALADLQVLNDETDTTTLQRPSSGDVSALVANLLVPFTQGPLAARQIAQTLEAKINPPQLPQPTPQTPAPPTE